LGGAFFRSMIREMLISRSLTLPLVAALTLAGAGLGVHFGRTAIAEINPVFYDHDDEYFSFASLSPNPPSRELSHPADFWASELPVSRDGYCPRCDDERMIAVEGGYEATPAYVVYEDSRPTPLYVEPEPDPAIRDVERYASFQVTTVEVPSEDDSGSERQLAGVAPGEDEDGTDAF
jgi:hypothetical protein